MASCAYCGTTILFGGKRINDLRFCNEKCLASGAHLTVADQVPSHQVTELASTLHRGPCPKCQGPGPIDVHKAYTVWSALYLTSWKTKPLVVCRACGTKAQIRALLFSALFGWWGIPWGFFITPMQIVRNVSGLRKTTDPFVPSEDLRRLAQLHLAKQVMAHQGTA
jgi:hypothetical protein